MVNWSFFFWPCFSVSEDLWDQNIDYSYLSTGIACFLIAVLISFLLLYTYLFFVIVCIYMYIYTPFRIDTNFYYKPYLLIYINLE